jgi:ABC-type sugar transport system ATPase subunit
MRHDMAEVILQHIGKTYPSGIPAITDLDLRVPDSELLVLLGPSGSGKTTALRLIAGLESPTSGTVHIAGRDVTRLAPHRRDVAMVFQRPALYPHLNVQDNLLFGLRMRRPPGLAPGEARRRMQEIAGILRLREVLDRRPAALSGGQQQRVALGRALVRRPAVLLLDEPLAQLDTPLRLEMRRELHLLQRGLRATIIGVTHDQDEAMALGDRVAVLDRGRLQQVDRPAVLYECPANRFVAGFLGSPPINLLDGQLVCPEGRLGFQWGGRVLPVPPRCWESWQGFTGRPLTLGIRPEHVGPARGSAGTARFTMEVALVERLGPVSLVTLAHGDATVMARLEGACPWQERTAVEVELALEQASLFDQATGRALSHSRLRKDEG